MPPIVLLTDFGRTDAFVGTMKGVILSRCPGAQLVDLTHEVAPQDIRRAAFLLMDAVPYFPDGSLFVSVVDPGVGSARPILWARSGRHSFLAPDNGLLSWVDRREPLKDLRRVENDELFLKPVSATFHGRDVFAPVAAALANGLEPARLGPRVRRIRRIPFPAPRRRGPTVRGEILLIDRFGNALTNLAPGDLPRGARLRHRGAELGPVRTHYAAVDAGAALAVLGSSGFVELAVRDGNFARDAGAATGDLVEAGP